MSRCRLQGKVVDVQEVDKDRYGRVVANVHVGSVHVNRAQVANGLAWRYVQYDKRGEFTEVEQAARRARKGLWADANPVPPWEWRKSEKERKAAKKGAGVGIVSRIVHPRASTHRRPCSHGVLITASRSALQRLQ